MAFHRQQWSSAMSAAAALDFPHRSAETDALAQQWLALLSGHGSHASDLRVSLAFRRMSSERQLS